jgi:hypothetical protein
MLDSIDSFRANKNKIVGNIEEESESNRVSGKVNQY